MVAIYYWNSFIYDVLAYFFTALALFLYIGGRRDGNRLTVWRGAAVILAYFAAINSKEIAIVGALWILGYEILVPKQRRLWTPAILAAVALVFTGLRIFGPGSLSHVQGYEIELTLHRFVVNNTRYLNQLFYTSRFRSGKMLLIFWIARIATVRTTGGARSGSARWRYSLRPCRSRSLWFRETVQACSCLYSRRHC